MRDPIRLRGDAWQRPNIDFEAPVSREQWDQIGQAAAFRPDYGVLSWSPAEWEVIHVAVRGDDAPEGWEDEVPRDDGVRPDEREVARFVYNDGRPYAQIVPPSAPTTPAVLPQQEQEMQVQLDRWVRGKWHELLRSSGLHYDSGARLAVEPNPPQ
jgi:hypothetical protein